jgi:hypothetical protein
MALATNGEDPIQRLDRQIAAAKRKGDNTEVMEGLKRFLQLPVKHRRRATKQVKPIGARKSPRVGTSKPNTSMAKKVKARTVNTDENF